MGTTCHKLCKTLAQNIFLLSKLKRLVQIEYCILFFNSHIKSHYEYASTIWDQCSANHFDKINSLFNRAIKILAPKATTPEKRLKDLNMLSLRKQLDVKKCVFVHKILNNKCPTYMYELIIPCIHQHDHDTRNSSLRVPRPRIDLNKQSFKFSGINLYMNIPMSIRTLKKTQPFKHALSKHFKRQKKEDK